MTFAKCTLAIAVTMSLAACGGGGGDSGTPLYGSGSGTTTNGSTGTTDTTAASTISVSLSSTTVTSVAPVTVKATVKTAQGLVAPGVVVTFASKGGLGTLSAASALTDASGIATTTLYPVGSSTAGADELVATATVNGAALTSSQGFQLTPSDVTVSSFTSDIGTARLSASGQTTLRVAVAGAGTGAAVTVGLSSTCVLKGKATIAPATVTTTSGSALFTYTDTGCGITDLSDTVQATVSGSLASTPLQIPLTAPEVNSIAFVSATPATIYLASSNLTTSSLVSFKINDRSGNAVPFQTVTLEATTYAGGLTVDGSSQPVVKTANESGVVTAVVNSGTVPTPVRIKATLNTASGAVISSVSSGLSIAVGLPSQLNFSLSQATRNIEGMNIDGVSNTYSIIASDRLGNPVPNGTAVNFVAEGGQVQASAQTTGNPTSGGVSVAFQSASPRPDDGRVTVVAYALGEESFLDTNGNNVWNSGEAFQDLGNIFLSRDFTPVYKPATDQFISLASGTSTATAQNCATVDAAKDPLGLLSLSQRADVPTVASTCDGTWGRAYVRRSVETVLSTSTARPLWFSIPTGAVLDQGCSAVSLVDDTRNPNGFLRFGAGGLWNVPASGTFRVIASDANSVRLNPMAATTVITAAASTGLTVVAPTGTPVPSTTSATTSSVGYAFDTGVTSGIITLSFQSPSGLTTSFPVNISTAAAPNACPL